MIMCRNYIYVSLRGIFIHKFHILETLQTVYVTGRF